MAATLEQAIADARRLAAKRNDPVMVMYEGGEDPPEDKFWVGSFEWADALFPAHQDAVAVVNPDGSVE